MSSSRQQRQLKEQLFSAIESKNNFLVEQALLNGANINAHRQDIYGNTPLIAAIKNGSYDLVTYLIDHGADVNIDNDYFQTPLMIAINYKLFDLLAYLLDHGANVNAKGEYGDSLLMTVIDYRMPEMVTYLIDHGADVHAQNDDGHTALSRAISHEHSEIVKLLLARGATYTIKILMDYIKQGNISKVREVVSHGIKIPPEALRGITDSKMLKFVQPYIQSPLGKRGLDNPIVTSTKRSVNYDISLLEDYIITNDYDSFKELLLTSPLIRDKLQSYRFRHELRQFITQLNDKQDRSDMLALYDISLLRHYITTNDYNNFKELLLTSPLIREKLQSSKFRHEVRQFITQFDDKQRSDMLALYDQLLRQ